MSTKVYEWTSNGYCRNAHVHFESKNLIMTIKVMTAKVGKCFLPGYQISIYTKDESAVSCLRLPYSKGPKFEFQKECVDHCVRQIDEILERSIKLDPYLAHTDVTKLYNQWKFNNE